MFFVDKPYVSDFLKQTLKENNLPVVGTDVSKQLNLYEGTRIISEENARKTILSGRHPILYTTSENTIGWISKYLWAGDLPQKIAMFKNKAIFREITRPIFPDFFFKKVPVDELKTISFDDLPTPFIIKPAVGFFSMGVHKVSNLQEWQAAIDAIYSDIRQVKGLYPLEVLNADEFIIEQCIDGEEFAVDAYFNASGEPVILGIFKHMFSSEKDVSDRVYISSRRIIEENLDSFSSFIGKIGHAAGVKHFPVHVEFRRNKAGMILPIEVNPMRFGGWCTTADLTCLAYGFNPYLYYYTQKEPDWETLLKDKDGKIFSIIVLDNSTGVDSRKITSFDYDALWSKFETPLELRKIDYREYPVFAFLFAETRENNMDELKYILNSDLNEFIVSEK